MSTRRLAPPEMQPADFAFTPENQAWAKSQIAKYPEGRQASAVILLLWRAQEQAGGWVPQKAIERVAGMLGMPLIRVLEVATFYTMFNLAPVGRHFVQLCGTTPCMLRGANELKQVCRDKIGEPGRVTADGSFSWIEVECLGACVNAPMVQINYDTYEDLTPESFGRILDDLAAGKPVKTGPQIDRQFSAPVGGPTTLTDPSLYEKRADSSKPGQE
jgi:NADH-quinone oxidoreductase subunit E